MAHENARFAGFTKKAWGAHVVLHETTHYVGVTKNTQNPHGAATPGATIERGPHEKHEILKGRLRRGTRKTATSKESVSPLFDNGLRIGAKIDEQAKLAAG